MKTVIPLGLGWFRHVLSYPLRSVYTVFRNLETCLLFCYSWRVWSAERACLSGSACHLAGVCAALSGCGRVTRWLAVPVEELVSFKLVVTGPKQFELPRQVGIFHREAWLHVKCPKKRLVSAFLFTLVGTAPFCWQDCFGSHVASWATGGGEYKQKPEGFDSARMAAVIPRLQVGHGSLRPCCFEWYPRELRFLQS